MTVIFHDLAGARAALAAGAVSGRPLVLLTAPGAAHYGGPAFWLEIVVQARTGFPQVEVAAVLDCGDDAAMAHAALTLGWRRVVYAGSAGMRAKLVAIAAACDGEVLTKAPPAGTA